MLHDPRLTMDYCLADWFRLQPDEPFPPGSAAYAYSGVTRNGDRIPLAGWRRPILIIGVTPRQMLDGIRHERGADGVPRSYLPNGEQVPRDGMHHGGFFRVVVPLAVPAW